jgi:hypothetical protein
MVNARKTVSDMASRLKKLSSSGKGLRCKMARLMKSIKYYVGLSII